MQEYKRPASVSMAIDAFERLERKRHQIERAERELHEALVYMAKETAGNAAAFADYVTTTETIRLQVEAGCRVCTPSPARALADTIRDGAS